MGIFKPITNESHRNRDDGERARLGLGLAETLLGVGLAALAATALIAALTGVASLAATAHAQETAQPGGASAEGLAADGGAPSAQASETQAAAKRLVLRRAGVKPRIVRYAGTKPAIFRFEFKGKRKRDVQVQVVHRAEDGKKTVTKRWNRDDLAPNTVHQVKWRPRKANGKPVPNGRYFFRVREQGGKFADAGKAKGNHRLKSYSHIFPVRGPHSYGDGIGAGRGHRGQDVFAKCGTKLVAARAGVVKYRAFQGSGAGHYVVIRGRKSGMDYAYMHLRKRAKVKPGQKVRTGQMIGRVGATGNATGCHLHFELWSKPGWYSGGSHMRAVTKKLRLWDRWG